MSSLAFRTNFTLFDKIRKQFHTRASRSSFAASVPVLAVDNLEVHVDSGDEHLAVDADLVDGWRRESVSHHHHPHDLIGHRAAVRQRHPDPQTPRDVDHLTGTRQNIQRGAGFTSAGRSKVREAASFSYSSCSVYYQFSSFSAVLKVHSASTFYSCVYRDFFIHYIFFYLI